MGRVVVSASLLCWPDALGEEWWSVSCTDNRLQQCIPSFPPMHPTFPHTYLPSHQCIPHNSSSWTRSSVLHVTIRTGEHAAILLHYTSHSGCLHTARITHNSFSVSHITRFLFHTSHVFCFTHHTFSVSHITRFLFHTSHVHCFTHHTCISLITGDSGQAASLQATRAVQYLAGFDSSGRAPRSCLDVLLSHPG
jgi:hypothetical protein